MSRILLTGFIGFGFALSGCQPTTNHSSATAVKASTVAPYSAPIAPPTGQPARPGSVPPPPQPTGPGGLPPAPVNSAPVPMPMPPAPMPGGGSTPLPPPPAQTYGGPTPLPPAPQPVNALPPPPMPSQPISSGPSYPVNLPSQPLGPSSPPAPGPQTVTPSSPSTSFPTVGNTPTTPSSGPLTYVPGPAVPGPATTPTTPPAQTVTPAPVQTPTPAVQTPAPITTVTPSLPEPAPYVPTGTVPTATTPPPNASPIVTEPPPAPVVTQPALPAPAPYIPPPTPLTQNAPVAALPPPPPAPAQGLPPPPAPVGTNWANIPNPMQSKFAVCNGGACPDQKIIPPAPPAREDCRLTQSCAPIVPAATPSSPPPAPAPVVPAAAPVAPVAQAPATPASKAGPMKKEQYGPTYVKPEDRGCSPIPLKIKPVEKLDIVIVMDTSASMRGGHENGVEGELGLLIPDMDAFARQLDPKTDIHMGMLLGHAPATAKSPNNVHARLFQADAKDPAVISYSDIKRECGGNTSCVKDKVAKILKHKMEHLPNDHTDAQGEALFSSLYDAVTKKEYRQRIQNVNGGKNNGLFRKDAYLVVITVSDEQEVCFDYSSVPGLQPAQVKLFDPKTGKYTGKRGADPHETAFYNSYCKTAANGQPLTYARVYQALKDLKGGDESQFKVMGIHYKNKEVPTAMQDKWEEMEQGHGYLDLIQMSKGRVADMALVNRFDSVITFVNQLKDLGKFTNLASVYHGYWDCKSNIHPEAVNISTVEVHVYDSQKHEDVAFFGGGCVEEQGAKCLQDITGPAISDIAYDKNGKYPYLQVSVDVDELAQALQKANFKQGLVYIYFKPRSDVDVNTGLEKR